jgi:hypothetical protein
MSNIEKVIASIEKLHGGERDQRAKHAEFIAWQKRQQEETKR